MLKKQILGLAFSLLYVLAMVKPMLPVLEYYANYDYIANELCINKDKPYLECNGKCYLNLEEKRINGNDAQSHQIPLVNMSDYPVSPITFLMISIPVNYQLAVPTATTDFKENLNKSRLLLKGTFHPPQFLA